MKWSRAKVVSVVASLLLIAGAGAAYLVLSASEPPPPVELSRSPGTALPVLSTALQLDPSGRWAIKEGSEAGYRVREKLARLPAPSDAVGRTSNVSGDLLITGSPGSYRVSDISVRVDMTSLVSDSPRRDRALKERGLETDRFPTASFIGEGSTELPADLQPGRPVELLLDGALTIHGVTRHASIPVNAVLNASTVEVVGSLTIPMADFGIEPPNVANIVSVEPTGTLEFRLLLEKAV